MTQLIYALIDPRDNQIRYVGKTKDIKTRLKAHVNNSQNGSVAKKVWIDELRLFGLTPRVFILGQYPDEDGALWEGEWYYFLKRQNCIMLNDEASMSKSFLSKKNQARLR